jgi:hypothetical protein
VLRVLGAFSNLEELESPLTFVGDGGLDSGVHGGGNFQLPLQRVGAGHRHLDLLDAAREAVGEMVRSDSGVGSGSGGGGTRRVSLEEGGVGFRV